MHCMHSSVIRPPLLLNRDSAELPLMVPQNLELLHMLPTSERGGVAASCFPHLGAGLGAGLATVGATSFLGIHFSSGM